MQAAGESEDNILGKPFNVAQELAKYVDNIQAASIEVNKTFTQGRQRVSELITSIAEATPKINRLGGSMGDVAKIMGDVAEASNRNMIASTEQLENLYAIDKVLGIQADTLTNQFLDVGLSLQNIPDQLEKSMNYVQSMGGNASSVMKTVVNNMDQMNRFQFEGGVQGLTKMAAKASMLRFDMGETFRLADKVLDPEGAIEVASAFQRLGVSAGNLVDPFQMMNMSINDPSGLQDSLADVAKQFTYFDEETKSFKINPQGVLTLREMEKQAGLTQGSLSKMAVAAGELDRRLSDVSMAGVTFENEEDKQYLANIANMGKGGEYEVKIKKDDGEVYTKKLTEITQDEFDKLIQQQKEAPKTMEDIARTQLNLTQTANADLAAIKNSVAGGIVSSKQVTNTIVGAQKTVDVLGGEASKMFDVKSVRGETERALTDAMGALKDLSNSTKPLTQTLSDYFEKVGTQMNELEGKIKSKLNQFGENVYGKMGDDSMLEQGVKYGIGKTIGRTEPVGSTSVAPLTSSPNRTITEKITQNTQTINTKGTVDVGGKIEVDVKVPAGLSSEQLKQILDTTFNEPRFKDYIVRLIPNGESKEPTSKNY